jgi:hypothetical protein
MDPQQPSNPWSPPGGTSNSTPVPGVPGPPPGAPIALPKEPMRPMPTFVLFAVMFGALAWTVVGAVGYNAASSFGPRVTEDADPLARACLQLEFEYQRQSDDVVGRG